VLAIALILDRAAHGHVIDRHPVAVLGLSRLFPELGGGSGPIAGSGGHRVLDACVDVTGDVVLG
jgi:hypothetical protein